MLIVKRVIFLRELTNIEGGKRSGSSDRCSRSIKI